MSEEPRVICTLQPDGALRLGHARTALLSWLHARKTGGRFILCLADMTLTPAQASFRSLLLDMLGWLGIDWDEGPDVGGSFGPYQQSERAKVYQHHAGILRAGDLLYPCYCSEEELENGKEPFEARGFPARYSGRCRGLSAAERRRLEDSGRRPVMRLKATPGLIEVEDLIRGATNFARDDMGDFVVIDDAGLPAQVFVQAVDHALMDVSMVIRSEDRLAETAKDARHKGLLEEIPRDPEEAPDEEDTEAPQLGSVITPAGLFRYTLTLPPEAFVFYNLAMAWKLEKDAEKTFDEWVFDCIDKRYVKDYRMQLVLAPILEEQESKLR